MPSMSRDQFLQDYVLDVEKEWEIDGQTAEWAPATNGPLMWGQETRCMELSKGHPQGSSHLPSTTMALSPDEKFLAIATNSVICIYTTETRELRAELIGHAESVSTVAFAPYAARSGAPDGTQYVIISGGDTNGRNAGIIAWYLDSDGKSLTRTMPFAIETLADQAMGAISEDLVSHHELNEDARAEIRKDFVQALTKADMHNRRQGLATWSGQFGFSYKSNPFSADGKRWLQAVENTTTQGGMRPLPELPALVVRDFDDPDRTIRLQGHKDVILWASFSPVDPDIIASASWDGTYRIWSVSQGTCVHEIGPTGGQNWAGDFSPDGGHVLLSGTNNIAIYSVATGQKLYSLTRPDLKLAAWIRTLAWSPAGDAIALQNSNGILLWRPFNDNKTDTVLQLKADGSLLSSFISFQTIRWLDATGQVLAVADGENTWFVWDRARGMKWRFQRPRGTGLPVFGQECVYVEETATLVTLDGDWKVRDWSLD